MTNTNLDRAAKRLAARADMVAESKLVIEILSNMELPSFIDDHNRGDRNQGLSGWALVEYKDRICPFPVGASGACLNPLYVCKEDGKVHLSRWSIGPYFKDLSELDNANIVYNIV